MSKYSSEPFEIQIDGATFLVRARLRDRMWIQDIAARKDIGRHEQMYETVARVLVGWRDLTGDDGKPITFVPGEPDANLDAIGDKRMYLIAKAAGERMFPTEDERKN